MNWRPVPPEPTRHGESSRLALYLIGGLAGVLLVACGIGAGYLILREQQKYDAVYQRLNMEHLPKAIENMPYVRPVLEKLLADPCNRQAVEELASGLDTLGQQAWVKIVRTGYTQQCMAGSATPTTAQGTLQALAIESTDADIRRLAGQVLQRACDQPAVWDLIAALKKTSANAPAAEIGDAYLARCGQDIPIAYSTMQSYYNIGEYDRSLALVDAYQTVDPNSPYWIAWRGFNLEKLGRTDEAANAYLHSLSLWTRPDNVAFSEFWRTATTLRTAGRNCEAAKLLEQYVSYDPAKRRTSQIATAIAESRAAGGGCS